MDQCGDKIFLGHEERETCHEEPELLNITPLRMSPAGVLKKAKPLLGMWPCHDTVTTNQALGDHTEQPIRDLHKKMITHMQSCLGPGTPGLCWGIGAEPC